MFDYAMNGGTASEDFGLGKHAGTIMATYERPFFNIIILICISKSCSDDSVSGSFRTIY